MNFLSLFSGIEAASAAWAPLGWKCVGVSEVDPYACAALAHLHPHVPNLGDVTKITELDIARLGKIDVIIFGSPCQDLSVAGKRKGLSGARSGLFFSAMQIVSWARFWGGARFALWENVPGAFSSNAGRDFAAVVDAMAGLDGTEPPPKGWGTEGCAVGTEAMVEWATLDAQWFGVAQRRRRVFALADFGEWTRRQPILLEPQGLRGDSAPRREAGQDAACGTLRSTDGGCDVDHVRAGHAVVGPLTQAFGGNNQAGPIDVATARNACASASGRMDFESETFLVQPIVPVTVGTLSCNTGPNGHDAGNFACNQAVDAGHVIPVAFDTTQITSKANRSNPKPGDPCHPLAAGAHPPAIAFPANLSGTQYASTENLCPSLCAVNPTAVAIQDVRGMAKAQNGKGWNDDGASYTVDTHATQGVAYSTKLHNTGSNNAGKIFEERTTCLDANSPPPALLMPHQVRRLTPLECERLQGFPDGHTAIPYRKKPAAQCPDGPRYKALGNSMAVPVIQWIGRRIEAAAR